MPRKRFFLVLLIVWVGLTFLLTSLPNPRLSVNIPYLDKAAHLGVYGVMGLLCNLWRRESGVSAGRAVLESLLFAAMTGAVDEAHQHWIPGRSMEFLDWMADTLGGGTGAVFSLLLPRLFPSLITE
ncbi:MAG TPA: VanZ family protein [Candidatus Limnocylindria bacterium]|nr:VanZ family protein [Candidatus Limnocylindria bacterium]